MEEESRPGVCISCPLPGGKFSDLAVGIQHEARQWFATGASNKYISLGLLGLSIAPQYCPHQGRLCPIRWLFL